MTINRVGSNLSRCTQRLNHIENQQESFSQEALHSETESLFHASSNQPVTSLNAIKKKLAIIQEKLKEIIALICERIFEGKSAATKRIIKSRCIEFNASYEKIRNKMNDNRRCLSSEDLADYNKRKNDLLLSFQNKAYDENLSMMTAGLLRFLDVSWKSILEYNFNFHAENCLKIFSDITISYKKENPGKDITADEIVDIILDKKIAYDLHLAEEITAYFKNNFPATPKNEAINNYDPEAVINEFVKHNPSISGEIDYAFTSMACAFAYKEAPKHQEEHVIRPLELDAGLSLQKV